MASATSSAASLNPNTTLCLACSASLPPRLFVSRTSSANLSHDLTFSSEVFLTLCCNRPICPSCLSRNPRLARYNPCLACLAGTSATGTRANGKQRAMQQQDAINVDGSVRDEDLFTLGDDDDEDEEVMHRVCDGISSEVERASPPRSTPPPAYSAEPCPPHNEALPSSMFAESGQAEKARTSADAPADQAVENQSTPSKYYVKSGDTLTGIALRFGVDGRNLCRLNKLPPSTLSTTPHLLHTRTYLTLPPSTKVRSTLVEPIFDAEEEERRAEARNLERAQKRFQFVTKEVDWRVAKTYVALAETEGDDHRQKEGSSKEGEGTKALAAGGSSARARGREEAAVDRYLDDDEWEARELREGRGVMIPTLLGPSRTRNSMEKSNSSKGFGWWHK